MFALLKDYFFTGVTGDLAYDALKTFWQRVFGKDLEDLYLDAFEQAVAAQRSVLSRYGERVELDQAALHRVLHADLRVDVNRETLSRLNEDEFIQQIVAAMHARQVLMIGGHNLTTDEYQSLLRKLIQQANANLRQQALENEAAFHQILLAEVGGNRQQLDEVQRYLAERFDLAPILQKLDAIEDQTRLVPEVRDVVQSQHELLQQVADDVQALRDQEAPQASSGPIYSIRIENARNLAIGNGAQVVQTGQESHASADETREGVAFSVPGTTHRQRLAQRQRELETRWNDLTGRIEAVQRDLGVETDGERKHTLKRRLADLQAERDQVDARLAQIERQLE
jgi:hypothetical protein